MDCSSNGGVVREREREKKKIRSFTATLADRLLPLGTPRGLAEKSHGVWQCAEEQVWKLIRPTASSAITSFLGPWKGSRWAERESNRKRPRDHVNHTSVTNASIYKNGHSYGLLCMPCKLWGAVVRIWGRISHLFLYYFPSKDIWKLDVQSHFFYSDIIYNELCKYCISQCYLFI